MEKIHIKNQGTTLIETLVYIALLSILMTGVLSSVYIIIHSEERQELNRESDTALILENYHE